MPTENDDNISIRSSGDVSGLGGADQFRWYSGNANIYGGNNNEHYDTDYYGEKNGGDQLYVMRDTNLRVRFKSTEDGTIETAGDTLNFTGIERLHLGNGDDNVNASKADLDRYGLTVYAEGGNDKVTGSRFGDFIDPGDGNDVIRAGGGADFIQGSKGDDKVYGGGGDDNIRWGWGDPFTPPGSDKLYGGAGGWDLVNVWIKEEWLNSNGVEVKILKVDAKGGMKGSSFTDYGGAHSTLKFQGFEQGWTHEGKDFVDGSDAKIKGVLGMQWSTRTGDDVVIGTKGNDTIEGGEGRDTITGGKGDDLIVANVNWWDPNAPGDGVRDVLIFRAGDGHDTVYAFDVGIDRLDVGGRNYSVHETNQGTRLDFAGGDWIMLQNVWDFA